MKAIYFDMDGTIADFYGVENWLSYLIKEQTKPYRTAKPLCNMRELAKVLNLLQKNGYNIGIVSWASKNANIEYCNRIMQAKINWLNNHIGSVHWYEIHIVEYGTPKYTVVEYPNGILFDDEIGNRNAWQAHNGIAFDESEILEILYNLL